MYDGECEAVGGKLGRETEILGENLTQYRFLHNKSQMISSGFEPGRRGVKPETNSLSYGTAKPVNIAIFCTIISLVIAYSIVS
jgi:hypothetical protein